jgi:hypothetical protein
MITNFERPLPSSNPPPDPATPIIPITFDPELKAHARSPPGPDQGILKELFFSGRMFIFSYLV